MACLWSVTLVSFQFLASMLWVREVYNTRNLADKLYHRTPRMTTTPLIVDGLSMTAMVLVLFKSYNRNHLRFTLVCDVLKVFNTKLNQSTKKANATKKMVRACRGYSTYATRFYCTVDQLFGKDVPVSQLSILGYSSLLHGVHVLGSRRVPCSLQSHHSDYTTSSFTRITSKMERVVIRNRFRSLLPNQTLKNGSDSGK
ncbi:hypothetical protein J6590_082695 [Homalodisca vitripennis]|nr:hypothetical protein J6590_082695 [Homalodisca vitripennis]